MISQCAAEGTDADPSVQKLIGANQNILDRIKSLQSAIGSRLSAL